MSDHYNPKIPFPKLAGAIRLSSAHQKSKSSWTPKSALKIQHPTNNKSPSPSPLNTSEIEIKSHRDLQQPPTSDSKSSTSRVLNIFNSFTPSNRIRPLSPISKNEDELIDESLQKIAFTARRKLNPSNLFSSPDDDPENSIEIKSSYQRNQFEQKSDELTPSYKQKKVAFFEKLIDDQKMTESLLNHSREKSPSTSFNMSSSNRFDEFMEKLKVEKAEFYKQLNNQLRSSPKMISKISKSTLDSTLKSPLHNISVEDLVTKKSGGKARDTSLTERTVINNEITFGKVPEISQFIPGHSLIQERENLKPQGEQENLELMHSHIRQEQDLAILQAKRDCMLLEGRIKDKDRVIEDLSEKLDQTTQVFEQMKFDKDKEIAKLRELNEEYNLDRKALKNDLDQALNKLYAYRVLDDNAPSRSLKPDEAAVLKQNAVILEKKISDLENELKFQIQKNTELADRINDLVLQNPQKPPKQEEYIPIPSSQNSEYLNLELETLHREKKKVDEKLANLQRDLQEREVIYNKELEGLKAKNQWLAKDLDKSQAQIKEYHFTIEKMRNDHFSKSEIFKLELSKINDLLNDLAKENTLLKKQVKILSDDRETKEKIQLIEKEYQRQVDIKNLEIFGLKERIATLEAPPPPELEDPDEEVRKAQEKSLSEKVIDLTHELEFTRNTHHALLEKYNQLYEENFKLKTIAPTPLYTVEALEKSLAEKQDMIFRLEAKNKKLETSMADFLKTSDKMAMDFDRKNKTLESQLVKATAGTNQQDLVKEIKDIEVKYSLQISELEQSRLAYFEQNEHMKNVIDEQDVRIKELESQLSIAESKLGGSLGGNKASSQSNHGNSEEIAKLRIELERAKVELAKQENKIKELNDMLNKIKSSGGGDSVEIMEELAMTKIELSEKNEKISNMEQIFARQKEQVKNLMKEKADLENEITKLEEDLEAYNAQIMGLAAQVDDLTKSEAKLKAQLKNK